MYDKIGNLLWPKYDTKLYAARNQVKDIQVFLPLIEKRRSVFQAGGACGMWAKELSKHFKMVYTFEPDHLNFTCLCHNTRDESKNIIRIQAAAGDCHRFIKMYSHPEEKGNAGAIYATIDDTGVIPMLMIDDLNLQDLDLLVLDIEGWEYFALKGAKETIDRCNPIIILEVKHLKHKHKIFEEDIKFDSSLKYLESIGYKQIKRIHRDVVFKR